MDDDTKITFARDALCIAAYHLGQAAIAVRFSLKMTAALLDAQAIIQQIASELGALKEARAELEKLDVVRDAIAAHFPKAPPH